MRRIQVSALGVDIGIEIETEVPEVFAALRTLLETYAPSNAPASIVYRFTSSRWGTMWRDGLVVCERDEAIDLVGDFELDLYATVAARSRLGWVLHGGAFVVDGRAAVLVGPSGAGKSTMTYALLARGARYVSDECVAIDGGACVRGLSRPIGFDRPPAIPTPEGYVVRPPPLAVEGSSYVGVVPPEHAIERAPVPVAAMIYLRHAPKETARARPMAPSEALLRLWPETMNATPAVAELAMDVVSHVAAFEVVTRTIEEGCESIGWVMRTAT